MDTTQRGKLSELLVLTRLVKDGYQVAVPFGNQPGWDLLVEVDGVWEKWQVKTAYKDNSKKTLRVNCCKGKKQKPYKEGGFDYLIAVHPETNRLWKFPFDVINNRRITVSKGEKF